MDLLAHGVDVQGVSLVINFDIPSNRENCIHRIGRSGRLGRKGAAINLVLQRGVVAAGDGAVLQHERRGNAGGLHGSSLEHTGECVFSCAE